MGQPGTRSPPNHSKCQSPGAWALTQLPGQFGGNLVIQLTQDPAPRRPVAHLMLLFLPVLQEGLVPAKKEPHCRVGWLCALPSSPSPAPSESSQQPCAHPKRAPQTPELPGQCRTATLRTMREESLARDISVSFLCIPSQVTGSCRGCCSDTAGTLLHRHRLLVDMFAGRRGHRHTHSHLHHQL